MPERKVWTEEQDKVLKLLRENRGERKWANIARIMEQEFRLHGRTGKQCRERYHNHLDSAIVSSEWTPEEQQVLYEMHEQIGNKWSLISQRLPGRSDNCVKNHFYSKLRKSLRRLNKIIHDNFPQQFTMLKESVLSKIIKTTEQKFKMSSKVDEELADFCNDIKNRLFDFAVEEEQTQEQNDTIKKLITDIQAFDKDFKKGYKGIRFEYELDYLKPPPKHLKKHSSTRSCSSNRSQSSSSYLSSGSICSSSDLSDLQLPEDKPKRSQTTGGFRSESSSFHGEGSKTIKSQNAIIKYQQQKRESSESAGEMDIEDEDKNPRGGMKVQGYENYLLQQGLDYCYESNEQNIHFNNIYYDNTPVIARIFGPSDLQSMDFFGKQENNEQDIQFKMNRMDLR